MINVTVITTADADMESFVTPKEIYLPDLQNEWGLDDAGESFQEEHKNILDDEDDIEVVVMFVFYYFISYVVEDF